MKKFFSLFLVVALVIVAMMFVACDGSKQTVEVEGPAVNNPASDEHHEHKLGKPVTKEVTCVSEGYTEYKCSDTNCNYVYRDNYHSDSNAHKYGKEEVITAPTCQVAKETKAVCQYCGDERITVGEVVAHNFNVLVEEVPANCVNDGYTIHKCQWCEETKTTVLKAKGHSFTEHKETVKATCTTDGYTINKCANCDEEETIVHPATGHNMSDWEVLVPNVSEYGECVIGTDIKHCQNEGCEYTETKEVPAHNGVAMAVVPPTCTTFGYTVYKCENCELTYYGDFKDRVSEHEYGDWHVYEGYEGYKVHYCTICGHAAIEPKED